MVRCSDESFYVGVTSRLDVRIAEHHLGAHPASYTYTRRPVVLVYQQEFAYIDEAIAAEKRIKGWSRAKKLALIRGDWEAIQKLAISRLKVERHAHPSTGSG
jgi:predicted GIY-YIG superfamily endonuclease